MLASIKSPHHKRPWQSWFWPTVIATYRSDFNHHIEIYRFWDQFKFVVDGITQSGGLVTTLWSQACKYLSSQQDWKTPDVLVLGLGAGSCLKSLYHHYPHARVTGIELDPLMIKLGKSYFPKMSSPDLNIIIADAGTWLFHSSTQYNLIIVDLYQGKKIPAAVLSPQFLTRLHLKLKPKGIILFNFLDRSRSHYYSSVLGQEFKHLQPIKTTINQLIAAS